MRIPRGFSLVAMCAAAAFGSADIFEVEILYTRASCCREMEVYFSYHHSLLSISVEKKKVDRCLVSAQYFAAPAVGGSVQGHSHTPPCYQILLTKPSVTSVTDVSVLRTLKVLIIACAVDSDRVTSNLCAICVILSNPQFSSSSTDPQQSCRTKRLFHPPFNQEDLCRFISNCPAI